MVKVMNRVREAVEAKGLTGYQLRKLTGIAPSQLYPVLNDPETYPSKKVLEKLCEALELLPSDLIYSENIEDGSTQTLGDR